MQMGAICSHGPVDDGAGICRRATLQPRDGRVGNGKRTAHCYPGQGQRPDQERVTNVVIVNRKGVQMRQQNGRYAPKVVPPAIAASAGPGQGRPPGTNGVVPVEHAPRQGGQGVYVAQPAAQNTPYRVVK